MGASFFSVVRLRRDGADDGGAPRRAATTRAAMRAMAVVK